MFCILMAKMRKFHSNIEIIVRLRGKHVLNLEHEDEDGAILTGWIFALFIFAIVIFALYYIRKYFYEAFYRIHLILAVGIFVMSILHGSTISAFGVIFWTVDFIMKLLIVLWNQKNSRKCLVKRLPCDVIQIKFSKGRFNYKSGQHVSILVPKVSLFEWHLFRLATLHLLNYAIPPTYGTPHSKKSNYQCKESSHWLII